jgi:hypothetical protein
MEITMSKREACIITIILAFAVIVGVGSLSPLGYDRKEFDYATGKIRVLHRTWGFLYNTTYEPHWLEAYAPTDQPSDWHLLRYTNRSAPRINTKGGGLLARIRSIDQALEITNADEPTRQLVADFIFKQLRLNESKDNDSVDADSIFGCLDDSWPYDIYEYKPIPIETVQDLLDSCTTPSTIPP